MIKTIDKVLTKTVKITEDVICNKCSCSCKGYAPGVEPEHHSFEGIIEAKITGGYGAKLGDGTTYVFSICEECLWKMFKEFKHPPVIYDLDGSISFEPTE